MATTVTLSDLTGGCRTERKHAEPGEHRGEFGDDFTHVWANIAMSAQDQVLTPATDLLALELRCSVSRSLTARI